MSYIGEAYLLPIKAHRAKGMLKKSENNNLSAVELGNWTILGGQFESIILIYIHIRIAQYTTNEMSVRMKYRINVLLLLFSVAAVVVVVLVALLNIENEIVKKSNDDDEEKRRQKKTWKRRHTEEDEWQRIDGKIEFEGDEV